MCRWARLIKVLRGVNSADVIEPLQNNFLSSSSEQNIFSSAECNSSCIELLAEFGDRALQRSYDPRASVDFHGRVQVHADLTEADKDVRIAANVELQANMTLSSGSPEKLLPQRKVPAQRPRIDLSRTSKAVAKKICVSKLRSSVAGTNSGAC